MKEKFSGKQIIKAGKCLINENIAHDHDSFLEATEILSYWRYSHEEALESAFVLVQKVALKHDRRAIFAKRLKRLVSIRSKLQRFQTMKLNRMQDIGGCRIIVSSDKKLRRILKDLKKMPEFNDEGNFRAKDYIVRPKDDGYRSFHLTGKFKNKSIEIQLRTKLQHYWATALEIVDIFTGQALKSNQGEKQWKHFFLNVSKQFAIMESIHLFDNLPVEEKQRLYYNALQKDDDIIDSCLQVQKTSKELEVIDILEAYAGSLQVVDTKLAGKELGQGYLLLIIDLKKSMVTTAFYPSDKSKTAEEEYIENERKLAESGNYVVALVSTSALGDIKQAYPNYFADSREFVMNLVLVLNIRTKKKNILSRLFSIEKLGDLKDI